jgi:acyl-CoA thioester hydrolase
MRLYVQQVTVGWADMDFNSHMRNTAYLDKAADVRMLFFADRGFPVSEFRQQGIGPVVMKDEVEYHRECHLLDRLVVTLSLAGLALDGSHVCIRNHFFREKKLVARVSSMSGWLDLKSRRLASPPPALLTILNSLERSENFQVLPSCLLGIG